jgi:DNA-binding transcriptional ArsR family regulator
MWHVACVFRVQQTAGQRRLASAGEQGEVQRMVTIEQPRRSRQSSTRVKQRREALLDTAATSMLQTAREVLCEPTRTQIVRVLSAGPLSVSELAAILDRSKSATSQHLRVLRDGGVVTNRRRGRAVIYSLVTAPMVDAAVQVLNRAAGGRAA